MQFWSLEGLVRYEEVADLQRALVERRALGEISDTVLFLEHEPVVTRGRGLQWTGVARERSIPLAAPLPPSIAFAESERGGDLTYHGPGQLVMYPIVRLDGSGFGPERDIAAFLRKLELVFVEWLKGLGLKSESREHATGVWAEGKKIASIGIAIRKWVVWHGLAINVINDLKPFHLISPCGFSPDVMGNLAELMEARGLAFDRAGWRSWIESELSRVMSAQALSEGDTAPVQRMTLAEAMKRSS
jgi:lipoyl(octanoyl) transferase